MNYEYEYCEPGKLQHGLQESPHPHHKEFLGGQKNILILLIDFTDTTQQSNFTSHIQMILH